jgi:hypothetical protein
MISLGEELIMRDNYPTGDGSGMSFIANRWVFTGSRGFGVRLRADSAGYMVVAYHGSSERVTYTAMHPMMLADAHAAAASLAAPAVQS